MLKIILKITVFLFISNQLVSVVYADWGPLINGGEIVAENDPVALSTVMLETERQYCSGTIISDHNILTAAHCIGEGDNWILIHFKGLESSISRKATRFFRHENYQDMQETTRNDVALIFFDGGLPDKMRPVELLSKVDPLVLGEDLIIGGYGAGSPQGTLAKIMLKVSDFLDNRNLIKFNQTSTKGICHGDSGGPAYKMINGKLYLAGLASYANEIDCSSFSVYTIAMQFFDWIKSKQVDN